MAWSVWELCGCLASRRASSAIAIRKSGWRHPVPSAKARAPYDNEVVKRCTAEITKTTVTQHDLSLTGGIRSVCLARKWIANCKPVDHLAVSHVLRVKCAGASMERSRDDE
jgi:hypothetical protein